MTDGTSAITTFHFVAMATLAVLVVIGIVAGMRLKRARVKAQREVEAHAAEAGVEAEPAEETPPAVPAPPPPPKPSPAEPSPPPIAERSAPGDEDHAGDRPLADQPIAAIAPDGTTAAVAVAGSDPDAPSPADGPLTDIKGLGPRVTARLAELGVDRVGQLAALDRRGAEALDAELGPFTGRMTRDRWLEQARLLAAGDRAGFEQAFGKL